MTISHDASAQNPRGIRTHHLWLVAALLGAATLHATAITLHDTSQRRAAAGLVARAVAEQVAVLAAKRLDGAALQAFAPAMADPTGASSTALRAAGAAGNADSRDLIGGLLDAQRAAEQCRCRWTLPATGAFRLKGQSGSFTVRTIAGTAAPMAAWKRAALREVAREELAASQVEGESQLRLRTDSVLGDDAAVTFVQRGARGEPVAVAGFVVNRAVTMEGLFPAPTARVPGDANPDGSLARLDENAVEVRSDDGRRLFGVLDSTRRYQASVTPTGSLDGLTVRVALSAGHIAQPLIAPVATNQLWHLGVFILATVVMIGVAVRSSRRETLIARARSDFVAGVSHELRMPLAQILLASETLSMRRERNETERMTLANSILREARRLIAMVENVLLFSRTGEIGLRPRLQSVAVKELLVDVIEAVQLAVDDAGQAIDADAAPALAVVGDRVLLRQALVNLVDNAMKYGIAGQRIRLLAEQPSAELVRLVVEDAGRGVPHAERARVFAPYERLARDQISERTGTGLGLAVVRQIVTACGGRVWLEEAPGGGTRAVIALRATTLPEPAPAPVVA